MALIRVNISTLYDVRDQRNQHNFLIRIIPLHKNIPLIKSDESLFRVLVNAIRIFLFRML